MENCVLSSQTMFYMLWYTISIILPLIMEANCYESINFDQFKWFNEPKQWNVHEDKLTIVTDNKTDFWQGTLYDFHYNSGHLYGIEVKGDFVFKVLVEAEFTTLYDQAGLMIYLDEKHWLKTGIEFYDGRPMVSSVYTNEVSDWAAGAYNGNPNKFYLRIAKKGTAVCIKYSTDDVNWNFLRLFSIPARDKYLIGPMACTPERGGLRAQFSEITVTEPEDDILHAH